MKKIALYAFFVFVFSLSFYLTYGIFGNIFRSETALPPVTDSDYPISKEKLESSYNFLLLGYGGAGHDGGNLSDVIIVVHIEPSKKRISVISVPRDLWVKIPVRSDLRESHKINAAYAIGLDNTRYGMKEPQYRGETGAGFLAKKVISEVTGLTVENYISIDFESFKRITDILGGIEVDVPVTFNDYFYPIKGRENDTCGKTMAEITKLHEKYSDTQLHHQFECRYEHIHFDKGLNKMNGDEALKFVRSRASAEHGGDFARSQRQQSVLVGMKNKLISMNALKKIDELYDEFKNLIKTDLDLKSAKEIARIIDNPKDYQLKFIGLTAENVLTSTKSMDGQFILIPKAGENVWNGVHKYISDEVGKP